VVDYPNLWGFARDVYQAGDLAETVVLDHVEEDYYRSHRDLNPSRFVAVAPDLDFSVPHERDRLDGGPPEPLT